MQETPVQAVRVRLAGLRPMDPRRGWDRRTLDLLHEMLVDQVVRVEVTRPGAAPPLPVRLHLGPVDIGRMMVDNGLATKWHDGWTDELVEGGGRAEAVVVVECDEEERGPGATANFRTERRSNCRPETVNRHLEEKLHLYRKYFPNCVTQPGETARRNEQPATTATEAREQERIGNMTDKSEERQPQPAGQPDHQGDSSRTADPASAKLLGAVIKNIDSV